MNMVLPYEGKIRISKLYGTPPPQGLNYAGGKHGGIDFIGIYNKEVLAIASGKVIRSAYDSSGWGNYVVIAQTDGYSCIYAHLKKREVVKNERVKAGQVIGVEGSSGKVTGAHLHLEIRKVYGDRNTTIDPAEYLHIRKKVGILEMEKTASNDDVSDWAKDAWVWATEKGLLDGTRPRDTVTREELAVVLQRFDSLK